MMVRISFMIGPSNHIPLFCLKILFILKILKIVFKQFIAICGRTGQALSLPGFSQLRIFFRQFLNYFPEKAELRHKLS